MIRPLTLEELASIPGWERIARALRDLPLCRAGFEDRTCGAAHWAILGLWPIGDNLEPVVRLRAADIAFSLGEGREWRKRGPRRETPRLQRRDELRKIRRKYKKLAREAGPDADWRALKFGLRCEIKQTELKLHRVTKVEIAERLADYYFELTGEKPNLGYTCSSSPTRFERLGNVVFDGETWRSSGKDACLKFAEKVGNSSPR
jgi:hypothetical protein